MQYPTIDAPIPEPFHALETIWRGYRFRSRLEARWSIFFTEAGIPYEYEPEGFAFDGFMYLPDFWLPEQRLWVEIKPTRDALDMGMLESFATHHPGRNRVAGLIGTPAEPDPMRWFDDSRHVCAFPSGVDDMYAFCVCPTCDRVGFEFEGRGARVCRHDDGDRGFTERHPRLLAAYETARSERFIR